MHVVKYCQTSYNSTNHCCKTKKKNEYKVLKLDVEEIINKYRVIEICAY